MGLTPAVVGLVAAPPGGTVAAGAVTGGTLVASGGAVVLGMSGTGAMIGAGSAGVEGSETGDISVVGVAATG